MNSKLQRFTFFNQKFESLAVVTGAIRPQELKNPQNILVFQYLIIFHLII
jgi:hypothetical protein